MATNSQLGGKCEVCQTMSLTRCGRCQSVFYCGAEHQRASWPTHKTDCKRLAAEKATPSSSSNDSLDPLSLNFTWSAYQASSHRKPLGAFNRPPPKMTVHPMNQPGDLGAIRKMTDPWFPEDEFKNNKSKAYEKLIDGFSLWCDDALVWKGKPKGLHAQKDPYPEFETFLKKAKPHLPRWWTEADTTACLLRARSNKRSNVYDAIEKDGFNEKYGHSTAAMAMRMWVDGFVDVTIGK
ncbi:hypothetical protein JCM3765_000390 [Sporobolomyces pararoseus]